MPELSDLPRLTPNHKLPVDELRGGKMIERAGGPGSLGQGGGGEKGAVGRGKGEEIGGEGE